MSTTDSTTADAPAAAPFESATAITADPTDGRAPVLSTRAALQGPASAIAGAELLATAHGIYEASLNGARGHRLRAEPGLDRLRVPPAGAALRRHRAGTLRRRGDRAVGAPGPRLVERRLRLRRRRLQLRGRERSPRRPGHHLRGRLHPDRRHRRDLDRDRFADHLRDDRRRPARRPHARCRRPPPRARHRDRPVHADRTGLPADHSARDPLAPEKIWTSPSGKTLLDFGQNLVGWLRFTVTGPAGTEITLRHAEVLEHEELGTRPLRAAKATDQLVLSGDVDGDVLRADVHVSRFPLCGGDRLARGAHRRGHRGGRRPLRHSPDRLVRVLP